MTTPERPKDADPSQISETGDTGDTGDTEDTKNTSTATAVDASTDAGTDTTVADATVADATLDDATAADATVSPPTEADERDPEEAAMDESRMSLLEHLSELRKRMRNAFIAFFVALALAYGFKERILEFLTRPIRSGMQSAGLQVEFTSISITEMFWVYFKLAIGVGILLSAPFVLWEMWKFIAPGLYRKEKRLAFTVVGATAFCFTLGGVFGYMALMEPAVHFMGEFLSATAFSSAPEELDMIVRNMWTMEKVVSFEVMMLLGCAVAFELPVILSTMGALGIVSSGALWRFNKYSLVLSALLGGILTPGGDIVSQLLLAGPIFFLYNVSIVIVRIIEKGRKKREADLEAS